MNKRAMLANLIGGLIAVMIGIMLVPQITYQINLAINCNNTNFTISESEDLNKPTDSFGGGGSEQFGGYTGEVKHKDFYQKVGDYAVIKSNETEYNQDCVPLSKNAQALFKSVPVIFVIGVALTSIFIMYHSFRNAGLV